MSLTYRLAFVLFFASFTPGHAASFDCTRAGTAHERHICLDPVLNASDTMMGTVFRSAVEAFPVQDFRKRLKGAGLWAMPIASVTLARTASTWSWSGLKYCGR